MYKITTPPSKYATFLLSGRLPFSLKSERFCLDSFHMVRLHKIMQIGIGRKIMIIRRITRNMLINALVDSLLISALLHCSGKELKTSGIPVSSTKDQIVNVMIALFL